MTTFIASPAAGARLLSNGHFTTLLTAAGTGFSGLGDCALTRWQGDPVEDADGYFITCATSTRAHAGAWTWNRSSRASKRRSR